jgi:hypothetical protein
LAHQLGSWRGVNERAGIVGSDKVDASFTQLGVPDFLIQANADFWRALSAPLPLSLSLTVKRIRILWTVSGTQ